MGAVKVRSFASISSRRRGVRAALVAASVLAGSSGVASCNRGPTQARPVASLAETAAAGRAFERLRAAWLRNDPGERARLRQQLEAFVQAFPADGVTPIVRLYWGLSMMDSPADWAQAERRLAETQKPPPGSARDLYLVAAAKILRHHHQPDAAVELLRPIIGKVLDGRARGLLQEELTFDALEAREPYEAIAYMDAWLRGATEEEREATQGKVAVALGAVPEAVLRGSLTAMRAGAQGAETRGYGAAIQRLIAERLGQIAVEHGDATLARWLLDPHAAAPLLGDDASGALGQLATSKRGIGSVAGQTVGLVLPTSSAELRDEAVEVLRGVLWALGIGRDDADPEGAVRLVTRDDGGEPARLPASLEEVAGEGASVVLTALDAETAKQALSWGAATSFNVIALAMPAHAKDEEMVTGPTGFTVGEDWSSELAVLERALGAASGGPSAAPAAPIATMADREDVPGLSAAEGGPGSSWRAPVSCDSVASRAGESRFPLVAWDRAGVHRWLVAGSPACADDLLRGLRGHPRWGTVALSLEASGASARPPAGIRLVSAATGIVPLASADPDDPRVSDERAMVARTGAPAGWWAALGHDAAILARAALASLPGHDG